MSFVLQLETPERCEEPGQSNITTLSLRETPTGDPMRFVVQLAPHDNEVEKICNDMQPVTSVGVAKSTIVYSGSQSRIQIQQNTSRNTSTSSPGVIAAVAKSATIVYSANKAGKEAPKIGINSDSSFRAATQQSTISTAEQPHHLQQIVSSVTSPISVSSLMTTATQPVTMKSPINNIVNLSQPPKLQMAYEISQSNKQQLPTIIQGAVSSKVVGTANLKAITSTMSIPNVQRIHTKTAGTVSVQAANIQKFKTITTVNNQGVTKNFMSRVQAVPKTQVLSGTTVQSAPIAQIANNSNVQRVQQNTQKAISIQKSQNQVIMNARVNSNHKAQPMADQTQAPQKNPGLSPKTVTVQKQTQQQKSQQIIGVHNIQRGPATGFQKAPIFGQIQPQTSNNAQHLQNVQQQKSQVILPTQKSHPAVIANNPMKNTPIVSNAKSSNVHNMTKVLTNSLIPVNKAQLSPQTQTNLQHALQAQHIVTQVASQSQQQTLTKQQVVSLSGSRTAVNTNVIQQNSSLTGLPVNTKGSVVVTTKMQSQQAPMVLRVGPVKNSPVTGQSSTIKTVGQKSTNPVKSQVNAQVGLPQTLGRTLNAQPMKIIQQQQQQQQQQNLVPNTQVVHKQPGGIKTIPAQKSTPRNNAQSKVTGIKTSLNTNMNSMKNQSPISTIPQKTNVKTLLPQQSNAANLLAYKNSAGKTPVQNIQQKLTIVAPQYPPSCIRAQPGVIKTILPVVSPEFQRDTDIKCEPNSQMIKEEENGRQPPQSPVRRMPLPYECLQFVLQDHNYGAPPPRTPPPASPPPHPKQQPINGASGSTLQHPPFMYNPTVNDDNAADDAASAISSETGREAGPEGEETETAAEGEGDDEDSITRCICEFEHDDGYMICCDRCLVWQHVDCMGIDRANIPDEYLCEICRPRRVDRQRARTLQMRKREELLNSDTSSDTSSTSSADTDVGGANVPSKKRSLQQQQQSSLPRRKSDPPQQSRKLNNNNNNNSSSNNNNNNNIGKRQRREQHPRQPNAAARRKETMKRGPGKRKPKQRRISLDGEEETQDAWGSNMAPLRQWIEKYEEAVTNHYSPELRARISSIKVNGTHSDLRQSNLSNVASGKCRLNVHSNSIRFLVATMYLPANTPVIELRGKYMLSTQHRSSHPQGRHHVQRPGPFVFFYRLPRDGTEVCVDTRTYGNDARFVRRSCKPNAEVKHCIEKGTLHLYIVTTTAIEKNVEITIRHEQHELILSPNSSLLPLVCACGNPRLCQIATATQPVNSRRSSNGALGENADGRERRRRGRRNTVCDDSDTILNPAVNATTITQATTNTTITTTTTTTTTTSTVTSPATKKIATTTISITTPTITASTSSVTTTPVSATASSSTAVTPRILQNDEVTVPAPQAAFLPGAQTPERQETKKDKKKMTREERKMEAIMKAFERLEKAEQRKQEVQARNAQRKESEGAHSDNEDLPLSHSSKPKQQHLERPMRRKRRKGRARTTSSSNSSRRTRLNSADSDISSGEESIITQSPQSTSQMCIPNHESQFSLRLHTSTKDENGDPMVRETNNQMIPTAAGLLLALANSNIPGPCSPPLQQPIPSKSPTCDSGASSSSQSSTPSTPLSSACLLVAAAVGPLAPGFKFPKTKKVMMNEWLRESPDPSQTHVQIPQISPNTSMMSSSSSPVSANLSGRPTDFISPSDPSPEFLSQSYAAKSLATLVQAANSVSGLCDSSPQRKQTGNVTAGCPVSSGSAKKRWLRQAISEECDSPNSRPESPPSEMVAPPKKRRIARESISSDNYTPPTTPTLLISDSGATSTNICNLENDYIVQSPQSPLSLEEPIKNEYECEQMKDETSSEPDKCDFYDSIKSKIDIDESILMETMENDIPMESKPVIPCLKFPNATTTEETKVSSEVKYKPMDTDVKNELIEDTVKIEENKYIKHELQLLTEPIKCSSPIINTVKSQPISTEIINKVILIDEMKQDDTETKESKLCKTEIKLEFSGSIADMVNNANENDKSQIDLKIDYNKETRSDDGTSIDEFDVEAQMKKITGDDGNDYKEKVETNSDKDKSMDGIEGLMDSSKDDSESDDCDLDNNKVENEQRHFKEFNRQNEERAFKDLEKLSKSEEFIKDTVNMNPVKCLESLKSEQITSSVISSEESMFDSVSSNIDCEPILEPSKIFHSIPPLSERIRKKADPSTVPKKTLDFEAAIIESTIDMESIEISENGDQKTELSTALRELLEAKIDSEPSAFINTEIVTDNINPIQISESMVSNHQGFDGVSQVSMKPAISKVEDVTQIPVNLPSPSVSPPPPPPPPPPQTEIRRLKDPRTAIPNEIRITSPKQDNPRPVKRKVRTLSITEYRKRKQQSSNPSLESEPSVDASSSDKSPSRGRSDSASSGTSSLSSDEENAKATNDLPSLTTLPLFAHPENDDRKGGEEGTIGWSAAPTLVERQRENLTERLKREFGLFLSDDEEERARKQGLTAEAILKARTEAAASPQSVIAGASNIFPPPQLPPQPYIPPPGSASIHYTQYQTKLSLPGQYPSYTVPVQTITPSIYPVAQSAASTSSNKQAAAEFLVPQAPPGANPYPPQFDQAINAPVTTTRFASSTTSPPPVAPSNFTASIQNQKAYFNHSHSTPRT